MFSSNTDPATQQKISLEIMVVFTFNIVIPAHHFSKDGRQFIESFLTQSLCHHGATD